jgi:hypothetical protein
MDSNTGGAQYTGTFTSTDGISATISGPATGLETYSNEFYFLKLSVFSNGFKISSPAGATTGGISVSIYMNAMCVPDGLGTGPNPLGNGPLLTGTYTSTDGSSFTAGGDTITFAVPNGPVEGEDFSVSAGPAACFCTTECAGVQTIPGSSYSVTITSVDDVQGTGISGTAIPHGTLTATMPEICLGSGGSVVCDGGTTVGTLTLNF